MARTVGDSSGNFSKEFWGLVLTALAELRGAWTYLWVLNWCSAHSFILNSVRSHLSATWVRALATCVFRLLEGLVVMLGGSLSERSGAEPRREVISLA